MPTIKLIGHQYHYPLADVLQIFWGAPQRTAADLLQAGPQEPLIISKCIPVGPDQVLVRTDMLQHHYESYVTEKSARREVKRQLYQLLSAWTGIVFPWGSLTGIRPTLVAWESLMRTDSTDLARKELTDRWFVSPEKADLALETAQAEHQLLEKIPADSAMVYLGVPFCPSRCSYCSFITQDALHRAGLLEPYVEAVIAEAAEFFKRLENPSPISAVYLGGGTPTSLSDQLFARLLNGVLPHLPLRTGAELTVEAGRPDTITREKLLIIQAAGANRLCINPQTFQDATLARIGRQHTAKQTFQAFNLARSMGFARINMDLIAGLPGETPGDFADSLKQALQLDPESITVHTLAIKRSSRLQQETSSLSQQLPDPALAKMLSCSYRDLKDFGLHPYYLYRQKNAAGGLENTGYARPGAGCLYNVGMMSDQCTVIGLGSGSMTKRVTGNKVERTPNSKDIADYIKRIDELVRRKLVLFHEAAR